MTNKLKIQRASQKIKQFRKVHNIPRGMLVCRPEVHCCSYEGLILQSFCQFSLLHRVSKISSNNLLLAGKLNIAERNRQRSAISCTVHHAEGHRYTNISSDLTSLRYLSQDPV